MKKISVGLVDDHKLFRDALSVLINGFTEFEVVLKADNGKELISKMHLGVIPEILILDINMKLMDGFQTAEWLKLNHPEVKILALSMYENENSMIRMIRAGARGYLLKDIEMTQLHEALTLIAKNGSYYTDKLTGTLLRMVQNDGDRNNKRSDLLPTLTPKEVEFLKLVCSELTYKEIAEKMHLSVHTVDGYREQLFEKLEMKSRIGLVLYAIKEKIFLID